MIKGGRQDYPAQLNYTNCTTAELLAYIQEKFENGMTWENYGEWEIDHKIALMYEDPEPTMEEVLKRADLYNLQPLWKKDNQKKGKY
jgi:hypothetical protein